MLTQIVFNTTRDGESRPVVMETNHPLQRAAERGASYLAASGHTDISIHVWRATNPRNGLTSHLLEDGRIVVLDASGACQQCMFPPLMSQHIDYCGQIRIDLIESAAEFVPPLIGNFPPSPNDEETEGAQ